MNTILEFASLFNATGVGVVLLVSFLVLRRYSATFFRPWVGAYSAIFLFLVAEVCVSQAGRTPPLALLEVTFLTTAVWFLAETILHFRERRLSALAYPAVLLIDLLLSAGLLGAGQPFEIAALLPELGLSIGLLWLGFTMFRGRGPRSDVGLNWLGLPLIAGGGLPFLFPVLIGTPQAWIGFWLGGLFNTLIGIGMVVYLLEHTAGELREKNDELRQLDQMKNSFLATVSHELRTPLTSIKGAATVLATPGAEASAPALVPIVLNNAKRLEDLIRDMLDVSSIEAGKMHYQREATDLARVMADAAGACTPLLAQHAFAIAAPEEPVFAEVDAGRMQQVIVNLLSNAAKFTAPGGSVTLRLAREGEDAVIEVMDTGIGIAPEHHQKVFQKFFQVDGSDTRRANGSGLGLAIVKAIVEEGHGGRLMLTSRPGEGSTFRVAVAACGEQTLTNR